MFTDADSRDILNLEEQLAYFYGAKEPKIIANHYINALKQLEKGNQIEALKHLFEAYQEIQNQTLLVFDITKAVQIELSLIIAQGQQASFEEIYKIMINLYKEVFNCDHLSIQKAAMLRTFLYQYKCFVLIKDKKFSEKDKDLILNLARASEDELARFEISRA